jgi:NTE family protein
MRLLWPPLSSRLAHWLRAAADLAVAVTLLTGCATEVYNPATNMPLSQATPPRMGAPKDFMRENSIVLSLSGGGLRASAFAYGVLTALRDIKTADGDLLDDVRLITSVSGSSLTAAYYGLYGHEGLERFPREALLPGFESNMRLSVLTPANLMRLLGSGMNLRENFRDALDNSVFRGATFADMYARRGPEIRIHATDLYHRLPFVFDPIAFSVLCSDLSRYHVADAVAASMAVPMLFAPIVLRTFPKACQPLPPELVAFVHPKPDAPLAVKALASAISDYRDPARTRFIKLADGGLADNVAVSTLMLARLGPNTPHAPLTEREAVTVRRVLVIVADASRGPSGEWIFHEAGPSGLDFALAATDAAVDSAARGAADAFRLVLDQWHRSVVAFRCSLSPEEVRRLGGPEKWDCADVKVSFAYLSSDELPDSLREQVRAIPTRLTLTPEQIDVTIRAAREGMRSLRPLRLYMEDRVAVRDPGAN